MHRSPATIRAGTERRLEALTSANPEWRPWLSVVAVALQALDEPLATTADVDVAAARNESAPVLDGATVRVDGRAAAEWVGRLFEHAAVAAPEATVASERVRGAEALVLIEAAIERDLQRLRRFAATTGNSPDALLALADLAAFPVLQACSNRLGAHVPNAWPHGYCPVCGAWAVIAELRGLERARRLRCARCGGDWQVQWLTCPFCSENEHRKLGALTPEQGAETRRVDKCESCRGYVKTMTTLSAAPAWGVILDDAETVDLDLAALDHGYRRPAGPGAGIDVRLEAYE